jgi:hypothetical protein
LFAVAIVILGAVSVGNYLTQNRDVTVPSLAAPVRAIKSAASPMRVLQEHPAAKSVEVAGVRVVTGANKKPQLEYIVINHSANELTGLNIRITVRPADGQSDTPLFNVSNLVATLGPNQSREVRTDLDPSVAADSLTDWRSLRTEIFIAR